MLSTQITVDNAAIITDQLAEIMIKINSETERSEGYFRIQQLQITLTGPSSISGEAARDWMRI